MVQTTAEREEADLQRVQTLGSVRLHSHGTRKVILIPTPSNHPDDPLNWYVGSASVRMLRRKLTQLKVQGVPLLHGCSRLLSHVDVQLPGSRPYCSHRRNHH